MTQTNNRHGHPALVQERPVLRTEDQERGYAQYVRDQQQLRTAQRTALGLRKQRPIAKLLEIAIKGMNNWYTHYVHKGIRFDLVLMGWLCQSAYRVYFLTTSFVLSHALLLVRGAQFRQRQRACDACTFCKPDTQGILRCHGHGVANGEEGRTCDCPQVWWWYPSYLGYQIRLRNWLCPLGRFGRWPVRNRELTVPSAPCD